MFPYVCFKWSAVFQNSGIPWGGILCSSPQLNLLLPAQATNDGKVPLPDGLTRVLSKTAA